jgi:hypothetical protein
MIIIHIILTIQRLSPLLLPHTITMVISEDKYQLGLPQHSLLVKEVTNQACNQDNLDNLKLFL